MNKPSQTCVLLFRTEVIAKTNLSV